MKSRIALFLAICLGIGALSGCTPAPPESTEPSSQSSVASTTVTTTASSTTTTTIIPQITYTVPAVTTEKVPITTPVVPSQTSEAPSASTPAVATSRTPTVTTRLTSAPVTVTKPVTTPTPVTTKPVTTTTKPVTTTTKPITTTTKPVTTTTKPVTTTTKPVTTTTKPVTTTTKPITTTTKPVTTAPVTTPAPELSYYQNPIMTANSPGAWPNYGFGDPFVMRFDGMYYLYASTKDGNIGIKCWTSPDLVNWTYFGLCTTETISKGAYAPEVFYYNGYFYMYTSPAGNGHYVLKSESPTGPFYAITGNLGMSIDGSVFIDNDGKWYFYTAGSGSITAYSMSSPSSMSRIGQLRDLSVNGGWTEGAMIVYHDGYYYATYTGNHVLCEAYRIKYGVGKSPTSFPFATNNPLLISTTSAIHGIGHSSTVKGPDLDSYYIVYHSLVSQNGPNRNMNIDRIVFNGTSMEIMGPTVTRQQAPDLPDLYARFAAGEIPEGWTLIGTRVDGNKLTLSPGSMLISDYRFDGDYTAEYNVTSIASGGMAGAIFSYTDENNYGTMVFDPVTQKAIITIMVNGVATVREVNLIRSFGENVRFDCLQAIQIEKSGNTYTFYMNDRLLCSMESTLASGSIGYIAEHAEASFGFIGATGAVGGRGAADEYKSVSDTNGFILANTYTEGKFATVTKDDRTAVVAKKDDVLSYRILAYKSGNYDWSVRYFGDGAVLGVYVDGKRITSLDLPACNSYQTVVLREIYLTEGTHTVSLVVESGSANLLQYEILWNATVKPINQDFSASYDTTIYRDGNWSLKDGVLSLPSATCAKRLYGDKNWGDYTVEIDVTPTGGINCGLMVRTTNPGASNFQFNSPTDNDTLEGTDWFMGYFVGITSDAGLIIGKHSYSYQQVAGMKLSFSQNTTYRLKVVCEGANIKVYVDGTLYLDYTDSDPFLQGMVGMRTHRCAAVFDNFAVTPIE